jgi:hypothetical protein
MRFAVGVEGTKNPRLLLWLMYRTLMEIPNKTFSDIIEVSWPYKSISIVVVPQGKVVLARDVREKHLLANSYLQRM